MRMRRQVLISIIALTLCASTASFAQHGGMGGGIELHGMPGSITSPGVNGQPRGIAATVTDPAFSKALRNQTSGNSNRGRQFGHRGHDHAPNAVPYYGYYALPYYGYSDLYDQPEEQQSAQPPVGGDEESSSGDDSRYGEHYFDDRESRNQSASTVTAQASAASQTPPAEEPATTLVYRDGHKSEVRNYAIVGSNLIDLTRSPVLKKIPLDSLDLDATRKENEENGVDFNMP
jgi:hypothetical protein